MNTALNKRFNTTLIDKDLKISDYTLLGLILSYGGPIPHCNI